MTPSVPQEASAWSQSPRAERPDQARRPSRTTQAPEPLAPGFYEAIRGRLRRRAEATELDGLLLLGAGNVTYATGWHFSVNERPVGLWLPVEGDAVLQVPLLELENAEGIPGVEVRSYGEFPGEKPPVLSMIEAAEARRIAVDRLDADLLAPARAGVERLDLVDHAGLERAVKQVPELALIREAARFADLVLERLLDRGGDILRQGGTEEDLLSDCTGYVRELLRTTHGEVFRGTKTGITGSVHSGPRAALPHGGITARRPEPGDPIVAGIGCSLGGYHAESGVTLVVGAVSPEQRGVMKAMAGAGAATVDALERGLPCAEVDDAALSVLRRAGLSDAIRHRIGHGMGVEGHEAPWLAPGDDTLAAPGMVFSCEPGVYRPGRDGWRTIDTLIVGRNGVEVASRFQTDHPFEARTLSC